MKYNLTRRIRWKFVYFGKSSSGVNLPCTISLRLARSSSPFKDGGPTWAVIRVLVVSETPYRTNASLILERVS